MKNGLKAFALWVGFCATACQEQVPVWKDSTQPVDARVEDLLSQLTVEEKLRFFSSDIPAIERLGIEPYLWYAEALHGVLTHGATSFPQNNAMGSSWDRDLLFDVASAISDEVRALHSAGRGQVMIYSPTVNMARDPRWGRNEECYSEDPYMMSEMGRMFIRGMQGTHPKYLKTVCTVKHFAANNVEHKREQLLSMVSERDLREYYLPPYRACIVDERAEGVMSALNGLNTTACSANDWLLNTVLRDEWGFKGYVVADWGAVGAIHTLRRETETNAQAAVNSLRAGCDQECFRPAASPMVKGLTEAYAKGMVTEDELDVSLRRLLRLRFMVNGFGLDEDCPYNNFPKSLIQSPAHDSLALKAAQKTIVLLKNEKELLPLDANKLKSIAVVGPFADKCWLGIYSGTPSTKVSPLQGIKNHFKGEVLYAEGCKVTDKQDEVDMNQAIQAAKKADVVIAFVGNDNTTATENRDRSTLALPGRQIELLEKLTRANKKVIVVIQPSGSTTIGKAQETAPAIVCAWANGQQQGNAIADVLFGEVNPGGKLNTTWYAHDGQLPGIRDYDIRNNRTYMYLKGKPLYPFGYGLSYTQFEVSNLNIDAKSVQKGDQITVSVDVTNTGNRVGDEVVQLYFRDLATPAFEATKKLCGFQRVTIEAGKTVNVKMQVPYDALRHWDETQKRFLVTSGEYQFLVGNSSASTPLTQTLLVAGGVAPEQTLHNVSYAHYDANPRYHSRYYGGKIVRPVLPKAPAKAVVKKPMPNKIRWIEYLVDFVDPGFYVSEWTINLNYTSAKANTKAKVEFDGKIVLEDVVMSKSGKATHAFTVPKPDYDLPTRVRFYVEPGVEVESIDIVWPKDESKANYATPVSSRM